MPSTGVNVLEQQARAYLAAQLGTRPISDLRAVGTFDEAPLEGEGVTTLFAFQLMDGSALSSGTKGLADPWHYVAVGETVPNFFPAYNLDPNDAYSLHIGTRYMLTVGVAVVEDAQEPSGAREALHAFLAETNPGVSIEHESLAALFRSENQVFAVYRVTLAGQDVYCVAADLPPGFYTCVQHPPAVALRLHLGKLIRAEARRAERGADLGSTRSD